MTVSVSRRSFSSDLWPILPSIALISSLACAPRPHDEAAAGAPAETTQTARRAPNPLRNAYFGELHVHTRHSFDAYIFEVVSGPDDAYRFAKGEAIDHPSGHRMQLKTPFDFQAVTDHAFYLGMLPSMDTPGDPLYDTALAKELRELGSGQGFQRALQAMGTGELDALDGEPAKRSAWQDIVEAAERHNDPGNFTTFIGYEFTSTAADRGNLHRNVIFRGAAPDRPFARTDSPDPEDLWRWLDDLRDQGMEALAIPHNSNGSNGHMFGLATFTGAPLTAEYAETRMRNEPLVEVTQVKGTSETHPLLSPNDEWADFEIFPFRIATRLYSEPSGGYVREAYKNGLLLEETKGFNPFRFGLVAATDSHNAGGTPEEDNYYSKVGSRDGTPERRGSVPLTSEESDLASDDGIYSNGYFHLWGASGLTGVWAEENTRESIYDAFRRKETYGTTGTRILLRFFAGYDFDPSLTGDDEMIAKAYDGGVAMGSDLLADADRAPRFLVWAARDANSAPLQRVQIVKGWVEGGEVHEQVYDVACSDAAQPDPDTHRCAENGASVDLGTCSFDSGVGDAELATVWSDPQFVSSQRAVYYVRVLENPTCRWSTWDALRAGVAPRPDLPATVQERAYSSPIWYVPE